MNDSMVSIPESVNFRTLHDGLSAFAFNEKQLSVSLIGPLALAICSQIKESQNTTLNNLRKILIEKANFSSNEDYRHFDNAIVCAVGQLYQLGIVEISA